MKKKISLFANSWNSENLDNFIMGLRDAFDNDADIFVFSSAASFSQSPSLMDAENSIFFMPDYSFFDAAIILGSGITSYDTTKKIMERFREANIPIVVQGMDEDGVSSVTIDNYIGMKALCNHLIEEHHVKDCVFIGGTSDNIDSNVRLQALRDALAEHGYKFDDNKLVYANWERSLVESYIIENYSNQKNKLPDAIVCANDPMAMNAILALESIGYKVPSDVCVTGFDNLNSGRIFNPSVASVDQQYREQGKLCAGYALELINDRTKIRKTAVSCTAIPGESCGCINCKNEVENRKRLGHDLLFEKVVRSNIGGRISHLGGNLIGGDEFEDIAAILRRDFLTTTGAESEDFHIYINSQYKTLAYMNNNGAEPEAYYSPVMDVIAAKSNGLVHDAKTMNISELLLGYNGDGQGKTYVFHTIKLQKSIIGYIIMGYSDGGFSDNLFDEFRKHICTALERFQNNIKLTGLNKELIVAYENEKRAFDQTVLALATSVDAKDKYTHGHSKRVAEYSKQIAEISGKDEKTCEEIYYAALLHDVGKIGIADSILTKEGKLTNEEFAAIKQHPDIGNGILMEVSSTPYLAVGAHYHHERYDGTGYPAKLKGDKIPDIAKIIAVADAYDAMTSRRSYREPMPQQKVREELVKGIGKQFDPEYAKIMITLIDNDKNYLLRE